jgi:hypothetical protein
MPTISDIKKTKNSVNPMNRFSQLQSAGQSYRPGERRQEFATKLALGANLAENTKLTETPLCPLCPLCPLWLFLNSLIRSIRAIRGYLRVFVPIRHYICRESSTNQLLFMQNKPNVKDAQINVNSYMKSKYEKLDTWLSGKNKPNSNPIKPNLKKAKMNVNLTLTKGYRKNDDFTVRINKPNFRNCQNERKLNFNKCLQKKRCFRRPKNKPNTNPIQTQSKPVLSAPVLSKVEGVEWAKFRTLFPLTARPVRKKRYLLTGREIIIESSAKYHVSRQRQLKGVRKWKEKI